MSPTERQQVIDLAQLQINQYFDHYLTAIFPKQLADLMDCHNHSDEAHPVQFKCLAAVKRKVSRAGWMIAGMSALLGLGATVAAIFWR